MAYHSERPMELETEIRREREMEHHSERPMELEKAYHSERLKDLEREIWREMQRGWKILTEML